MKGKKITDEELLQISLSFPRYCVHCQKLLVRRRNPSGGPERPDDFGKRKFCNQDCFVAWKKENPRETIRGPKGEKLLLFEKGLKKCSECLATKSLLDFYNDPTSADRKKSSCRDCCKILSARRHLKRGYDLSQEKYDELSKSQGDVCAVCRQTPKTGRLHVDHCHKTHLIRGLLCSRCNGCLLPIAENRPEILKRVFEYLKKPPAFDVIGKQNISKTMQNGGVR